eukprot:1536184-Ditylum_brightwellii.AAC.1
MAPCFGESTTLKVVISINVDPLSTATFSLFAVDGYAKSPADCYAKWAGGKWRCITKHGAERTADPHNFLIFLANQIW